MFSFIKNLFTPKTIYVLHSELSNPRVKREGKIHENLAVLKILYWFNGSMKARDINRVYPSGDRRLNELFHLGYVNNIGTSSFIYEINDKGIEYINNNK